jgi:hypothetical protein
LGCIQVNVSIYCLHKNDSNKSYQSLERKRKNLEKEIMNPRKKKIPPFRKTIPEKSWIKLSALLLCSFLILLSVNAIQNGHKARLGERVDADLGSHDPNNLEGSEIQDEPTIRYSQSYTYANGDTVELQSGKVGFGPKNVRGDSEEHPLSNDTTVLFELDEVAIGTLLLTETGELSIFDDIYHNIKKFHTGEFTAEIEGGADMVAGNFDDDDHHELVISYEVGIPENNETVTKTLVIFFDDASSDFKILNTSVFWMTYASLCVGDFDGDGLDEVAMVGNHEGVGFMAGVVFDDYLAEETIIHIWDHIEGAWEDAPNATREHDIASGDFDGDGRDELATVGRINDTLISGVWEFNYNPGDTYSIYHGMDLIHTLPEINFSKDELIVTTHDENFKLYFRIHDDLLSDFNILKIEKDNITIRTTDSALGDIDGDGLDEIFVVGHHVANPIGRILDDAEHNFTVLKVLDIYFEDRWYYWYNLQVDCGDIDGDGIEEYVMLGQSWWQLHGELYDDLSRGPNNTMIKRWQMGYKLPSLALGNFDGDGFILEYTGEQEIKKTPEIPIVAMAAPPVIEGSKQDSEGSLSRFGIARPQGTNETYQMEITAELAISFEGEPIALSSATRGALIKEFKATETPVMVNVNNISFEGHFPDDYIIYQNTTFEIYTYKILSWPGHDDRVGENISINVPVAISIGYKTLLEFNPENSNGPYVVNKTFSHTAGNVESYSSLEELNNTLNQYHGWSSDALAVGEGTGYTNVSIDLGQEIADENNLSFRTLWDHLEWRKDEGFESISGLNSDSMFEVAIGENILFEGIVGNLQDAKKYSYSFGMFVYQKKEGMEDGHTYLVIDYWVEGYEKAESVDGSEDSWDISGPILLIVIMALVAVVVIVALISIRWNRAK